MASKFRPFKEARSFARSLELKNEREWAAFAKSGLKPEDIPSYPRNIYKAEWRGSGDWLGTGNVSNSHKHQEFRPFPEARKFARSLKIASSHDWDAYSRGELKETRGLRPSDIPSSPSAAYKGRGWAGLRDWLGTEKDSSRRTRPAKPADRAAALPKRKEAIAREIRRAATKALLEEDRILGQADPDHR